MSAIFMPFMMFMPFAPPIIFALFFDRIGPDKSPAKRFSRAGSGLLLALGMMYASFAFAMAGGFVVLTGIDGMIVSGLLLTSAGLAFFGFGRALAVQGEE
ncbi:hypothetical protein [Sphingomicrobium clamense]|uniref:Uncharacterized protein n=1 Tax=Sphingomicrobium clamense TaxID=2851013 RepID=A0ABS6V6T0_9SPHN|nr:hypothetical protein [Sphingomicrobium sp. B8]MBW0145224.1 hypothetical protein [Sphingomicrobium sp. B8]